MFTQCSRLLPSLLFLLATPLLQAAEWSVTPSVSLKSGYNDNVRLTSADHDSVWENILTPSLDFGYAREHQAIRGSTRASVRRYSGGSGRESSSILDREDYFFSINGYHRTSLDSFSGLVDYSRNSTLDSEIETSGEVVEQQATRESFTFSPSWVHVIDEKTRSSLVASYSDVSYTDDPGIQDLVDYDAYSVSGRLTRDLTERFFGDVSLSYSDFRPDTGFDSSTVNVQAGLGAHFSESLTASFLAGQRETTTDTLAATGICIGADPGSGFPACDGGIAIPTGFADSETDTTGTVFNADIRKTLESGVLQAALSRATNPGSQGELLDTTRLSVTWTHSFDERMSARLYVEYNERETIVNRLGRESDQEKQELFRFLPRISWRWRKEWEISGEYDYTKNKNEFDNVARRNALYLSLNYRPDKSFISR